MFFVTFVFYLGIEKILLQINNQTSRLMLITTTSKKISHLLLYVLFFLGTFPLTAAKITSTSTGGDWNTNTTWVGEVIPTLSDTVEIATTGTGNVTTTSGTIACAGITIITGSVLSMNIPITVNGVTSLSGTINFGSANEASNLMTFNGSVILNAGSHWNETAISAIPTFLFTNDFTNNSSTFTALTGVHTFSGTSKIVSGATVTGIPNIVITGTYTNSGILFVETSLTGTGGLINGGAGMLKLGGTSTISTLNAFNLGNTIELNGDDQIVSISNDPDQRFYNLILSGSGTKSMSKSIISIAGNFKVTNTVSAIAQSDLTIAGDLTIDNGATFNSGGYNHSIAGNWTNNGSFISTGSTIIFNGNTNTTISGINFNNIIVSGTGTKKALTAITATGNFSISSGQFILDFISINII